MSSSNSRSTAHPSVSRTVGAADSARHRWEYRVFRPADTDPPEGTLAEILQVDGRLPDHVVLGVGVGVARYLDVVHQAGHRHGNVCPASVLLPGNDLLWLTDPQTNSTGSVQDDLTALVLMLVKCATGLEIDDSVEWSAEFLVKVGCSPELAEVIGAIQPNAGAAAAAVLLGRSDQSLPRRSKDLA
jgi:hypothetical protein